MRSITLLNAKGGCGKTTIATNLAAYYANRGVRTSLTDYDPQASTSRWLRQRAIERPPIHGIDATNVTSASTRTWQLRPPADTQLSIMDTPAALSDQELFDIVGRSDIILIPVMPSHIDIHAVAHFIETLLLRGKAKSRDKQIGIIANRIRERTKVYQTLERFLSHLDIPLIARFRDAQNYVHANELGLGIHELQSSKVAKDKVQWWHLIHWLENGRGSFSESTGDHVDSIVG
ncbi:MAG: ParA family protein [Gammaproteobacteria bacterium]|nr:ParA family protein [Gammaproteobacteria bacterium]